MFVFHVYWHVYFCYIFFTFLLYKIVYYLVSIGQVCLEKSRLRRRNPYRRKRVRKFISKSLSNYVYNIIRQPIVTLVFEITIGGFKRFVLGCKEFKLAKTPFRFSLSDRTSSSDSVVSVRAYNVAFSLFFFISNRQYLIA